MALKMNDKSIAITIPNAYIRIDYLVVNPGTDIKFYVNGTLKATHTTNIPTTGTLLLAIGSDDNKDCYIQPITLSLEL